MLYFLYGLTACVRTRGVGYVLCTGAYSVRTGAWRMYVIGYLASSLLSLLTSVLVIIYSATGLAKDANQPYGVIKVMIDLLKG